MLLQFFSNIRNVIDFTRLPQGERQLVFYSEGKNYWVHLEGLLKEVLACSNIPVCYISSDDDDPGLSLEHKNYRAYVIDEGFVRNWLFENIQTKVMVMTMPDLNQYQVKKSKYKVHYLYVQHSLVSLHMVYRPGAFDFYDTIFCACPNHIQEIRAIESKNNLPPKILVKHGYGRLDSILKAEISRPKKEIDTDSPVHILIAPSWGPEGTIESGIGENIVDLLIESGYQVTFRPHPQTVKFAKDRINVIIKKYSNNKLFTYEDNVAGQDSLFDSDLMISDWSGAALDYAFGLNKPVLFIDVPKKVNDARYTDLDLIPFEVSVRSKIGKVVDPKQLNEIPSLIKELHTHAKSFRELTEATVFNINKSSSVGAEYLIKMLSD